MISILQGETLSFSLMGEDVDFGQYEVRAALHPASNWFRRDCSCGRPVLEWEGEDIDTKSAGAAVWNLTTEQSEKLAPGKYAIEVALRDIATGQDVKDSTSQTVFEVKTSYTR